VARRIRESSKPEKARKLLPYRQSLAGTLLAAREAVMAPIRPMLNEAGVTEQQWRVLRVLDGAGPMDLKTLAESALLFGPSLSRIIKDLADRSLVLRKENPKDGRGSIVSLTPSGRALIQGTARRTLRQLDSYALKFGGERLQKLISELQIFTGAIRED
jgi:homoprotocatechuate degradation regulator HpaR